MKKKLFIFWAVIIAASLITKPIQAQEEKLAMAGSSAVLKTVILQTDARVNQLQNFLTKYDSPLAPYASNFIEMADKYQIDWKLLPAIAGVESTFGKQIPYNSYNAYGWNNGYYRFKSWEDSIEIVSKALREKYYNSGLDNPYKIGPIYAPPSKTWASKVVRFMSQIEKESPSILTLTI